jgi:glutamate dehydrogenase (NAD(P)+)
MLEREPMLRVVWTDLETGRRGFAVVHRLVNGVALGGTRLRAGCSLEEVERLALTMSLKNGAFGIPAGGGKAGLDCDPGDPGARALLARFARALAPLFTTCLGTGEDMGTSQSMMDEAWRAAGLDLPVSPAFKQGGDPGRVAARVGAGFDLRVEGVPLVDVVGGYGVAQAALAAMSYLGWEVRGRRVAVQGFGSMGGPAALYLRRAGATVVAIADVEGTVANDHGLDVETLYRSRRPLGGVERAALRPDDRELGAEAWLEAEADLLIPAAVPDAIHAGNCDRVRASLIVEAANIPVTEEAAARLHARGVVAVPDFIANAATNAWFWWLVLGKVEPAADSALARIAATMRELVPAVLRLGQGDDPPRVAAELAALRRIDEMAAGAPSPAAMAERS